MKHDPVLKVDIKIDHDLGAIKALDKTQVIIYMGLEDRKTDCKNHVVLMRWLGVWGVWW